MPEERLPQPVETAIYFMVAEGLTNVAKYAGAMRVRIGVAVCDGVVAAEISDDGRGGANASGGSGLRGLADRLEAIGGSLEVESPPGGGTVLRARVPLGSSAAARGRLTLIPPRPGPTPPAGPSAGRAPR